ncbi:hypothetical protein QJS10_CPB17g02069 [Acorus calamus]|uniref:Uncharacterized protein n=1 Tax=Acorus calamus TaxID=4465 RepID=A0AAV9CWJ9_ACOCL|nr:hypothetical protein QJS10_CPB17g02069 [Acorus calamus]
MRAVIGWISGCDTRSRDPELGSPDLTLSAPKTAGSRRRRRRKLGFREGPIQNIHGSGDPMK